MVIWTGLSKRSSSSTRYSVTVPRSPPEPPVARRMQQFALGVAGYGSVLAVGDAALHRPPNHSLRAALGGLRRDDPPSGRYVGASTTTGSPPNGAGREEPLLWAVDGLVWAYGAGGDWRRRVEGLIEARELRP